MNNLETNALRIAELMGYKPFGERIDGLPMGYTLNNSSWATCDIIPKFIDYNGLMPIVFECNGVFASNVSHEIEISRYFVRIHIADLNQSADVVPEIDSYSFDYNAEAEFIESLQLAVIKYLEIKDDNSRVQQTI